MGLALEHVQPGGGNAACLEGLGQRRIVHDAAACDVDEGGGGLHQRQLGPADGVVVLRGVGQHQHQVVGLLQQFGLADQGGPAGGLGGGIEAAAVVINDAHAKAVVAPAGNALADAAHAQDAQRAAMHLGAGKHVHAPAVPEPGAQKALALGHAAGGGQQQGKAEVGGGFGQHVGGVGAQHAVCGEGRHIEIVEAHGHVGHDGQLRAGRQQLGADALAAGGQHAVLAPQPPRQLGGRPHLVGGVGFYLEMLAQPLQRFGEDAPRHQHGWTFSSAWSAACDGVGGVWHGWHGRAGCQAQTPSRSTSNSRVALGGITPPAPRAP